MFSQNTPKYPVFGQTPLWWGVGVVANPAYRAIGFPSLAPTGQLQKASYITLQILHKYYTKQILYKCYTNTIQILYKYFEEKNNILQNMMKILYKALAGRLQNASNITLQILHKYYTNTKQIL